MTAQIYIKIPDGLWKGFFQLGIPAQEVVRKAKMPLTVITESEVTTEQYIRIWQAFSNIIDNTGAGMLMLPTAIETAQYPSPVLAAYHARDYRDALNRMARYKKMCPPENIQIVEKGTQCTIEVTWKNADLPVPPVLIGTLLVFLLELGRRGTGLPIKATSVELTHSMNQLLELEDYFGCPVKVNAERNRLTLNREDLDRPFISYNDELLEILTPVLDQTLERYRNSPSIKEIVKWILKRSLTKENLDLQDIASELGMSGRTLQRRLTDEQTSFKTLLMEVRHEQAREYLANSTLDLKEVAFLLGYKDQSSFYRAFRFWEGNTPLNWRAENNINK
ncbi:AraC family transcriptional regulator [Terribacillus sp. AE2B 122]|uniref:AraC family transcriptional regulator n=1 Tax=Terribacillus sp. AE2B 122 TaxID=1331902 RepID=UPI00144084DD|nr:AraC family transcriptional regulator [Terribacillus sp. AE2B 122]VVM32421.1 probable transcriptional regulator [Terribacillus sp. AE2B 122]